MSAETRERVRAIVASYLQIPIDKVAADSSLADLGVDSLGALELVFQFEEEFKILVPNERAGEFTTVAAICEGIESLQRSPAAAK